MRLPISIVALKVALMIRERLVLMIVSLEIKHTPVQNIILITKKIVVHWYYNFKRIIRKIIGRNTKLQKINNILKRRSNE